MSRGIFGCHHWVKEEIGMLLASSRQKPGMLLTTLQYAEQTPTTKGKELSPKYQ